VSCRFAHHVIVANHLWHHKLVKRSTEPGRCTPILNYPDLRLFRPLPADTAQCTDRFVFLYPGTLNHHQGLDIAVTAFAGVHDQMPGAELHVYGEGPARKSLEALTRELGLTRKISIRDRVPLREVAELMASAQVGIVPKRADGFGNEAFSTKILEFMACGVPVIVSRTQVDAHYFNDSVIRFFTPGDEHDLARAMVEMYRRRSELQPMIAAALGFAIAHSWQERIGDYQAIVDGLVAEVVPHEAIAR
jgi:glycosyltransferase involved in cell wall biosynthesis